MSEALKSHGETLIALGELLYTYPQRGVEGAKRYLLAGGFSVDLLTGVQRSHSDLDVVKIDADLTLPPWVDSVVAPYLFGDFKLDLDSLVDSARTVTISLGQSTLDIDTIHPAITLVQKLRGFCGSPPRPKDIADAENLATLFNSGGEDQFTWMALGEKCFASINHFDRQFVRNRFLGILNAKFPAERVDNYPMFTF